MTHVKWDRGGDATILKIAGDAITLRSTVPAPPGAPLRGVLSLGEEHELRVKVHGSKKQSDGSFVIEGRCVDMSRDLRVALTSATHGDRKADEGEGT